MNDKDQFDPRWDTASDWDSEASFRAYRRMFFTAKLAAENYVEAYNAAHDPDMADIKVYDGALQGYLAFWVHVNAACLADVHFLKTAEYSLYVRAYPDDDEHCSDGIEVCDKAVTKTTVDDTSANRYGIHWIDYALAQTGDNSIWLATSKPKASALNIHNYQNVKAFSDQIRFLKCAVNPSTCGDDEFPYPVVSNELGYKLPDASKEAIKNGSSGSDENMHNILGRRQIFMKAAVAKKLLDDLAIWYVESDVSGDVDDDDRFEPLVASGLKEYDSSGSTQWNDYDASGPNDQGDNDNLKDDTVRAWKRVIDAFDTLTTSVNTTGYASDGLVYYIINGDTPFASGSVTILWTEKGSHTETVTSCANGHVYNNVGTSTSLPTTFYDGQPFLVVCE